MRPLPFLAAFALAASVRAGDLQILFPLYSYPNWYDPAHYIWDDVAAANATVPITAIIDPNNGPDGGPPNADYVHGLADLSAGGVKMLGYVSTRYGDTTQRPLTDIEHDIDLYDQFFTGVSGIFLDEQSNDPAKIAFYKTIRDYILTKPHLNKVVANPGTNTPEGYISAPTADTTIIFENGTGWNGYATDSYVANYPRDRFDATFYNLATPAEMHAAIDLAAQRNIGYVFATDQNDANPYDGLPSYWADEVNYVANVPEPSAWILCVAGILPRWRRRS